VRPGPYGGSTSQGQPLNMQVTPDSTTVSTFNAVIDLTCPAFQQTLRFDLHWMNLRINPDRTFQGQDSEVDSGLTATYLIAGQFPTAGPATGTLQVDLKGTVNGVVIDCTTRAVGWTANPQ
jgi:hypothetical protein